MFLKAIILIFFCFLQLHQYLWIHVTRHLAVQMPFATTMVFVNAYQNTLAIRMKVVAQNVSLVVNALVIKLAFVISVKMRVLELVARVPTVTSLITYRCVLAHKIWLGTHSLSVGRSHMVRLDDIFSAENRTIFIICFMYC